MAKATKKAFTLTTFACRRCGECCKGDGIVNLTETDIRVAARWLGIPSDEFERRYTTETEWGGRWLIDQFVGDERWCVFLQCDEAGRYGCRIQPAKPEQCQGFPYKWREKDMVNGCQGLRD